MSEGRNYIIVNNEAGSAISDGVADLVRYVDQRGVGEELAPVVEEFKAAIGPQSAEELPLPASTQPIFVRIAQSANALLRAPPSEFEPAFNLLWYVLSSAPDFDAVSAIALERLTTTFPAAPLQQRALLAVLSSLFNITDAHSPQKPAVFSKIVDLAVTAQATAQLVPQLPQLAEWMRDWQITAEAKQELVSKLCSNIPSQHHAQVLAFLVAVVTHIPELDESARMLITRQLEDISAYDFDATLALPGVQALAGRSEHHAAMQHIAVGDYAGFTALGADISHNAALQRKARVTATARLAAAATSKDLPYSTLQNELGIQAADVEPLLVDTMKAGLIRGRMNQLQEAFYIESASVIGSVTDHHWTTIEARLNAWKKSLGAILDVSQRARSNHDLVKTLNKLEVN